MKFNTYYINLEGDISRKESTIHELNKINLNYQRFQGIDGKTVDKNQLVKDNTISSFCKVICTDKMIGCGISHIMLYRYIEKNDNNDVALILEDDIIVTDPSLNYTDEITKIVNQCNKQTPDWQIIRLHSMIRGTGSAAAQIINLKHIQKLSNMKLHYYNDFQQNFEYKIIKLNTLFNTKDYLIQYKNPLFNIYLDNQKIGFYLNNHIGKLFNYTILFVHFLIFILSLIFFFCKRYTLSIFVFILFVCYVQYSNIPTQSPPLETNNTPDSLDHNNNELAHLSQDVQ